jgi:hypothetical protein
MSILEIQKINILKLADVSNKINKNVMVYSTSSYEIIKSNIIFSFNEDLTNESKINELILRKDTKDKINDVTNDNFLIMIPLIINYMKKNKKEFKIDKVDIQEYMDYFEELLDKSNNTYDLISLIGDLNSNINDINKY